MYYAITNEEGRTIESFDDEHAARHAVRAMVDEDPDFADDVMLLIYVDQATPIAALGWDDIWAEVIGQPPRSPIGPPSSTRQGGPVNRAAGEGGHPPCPGVPKAGRDDKPAPRLTAKPLGANVASSAGSSARGERGAPVILGLAVDR